MVALKSLGIRRNGAIRAAPALVALALLTGCSDSPFAADSKPDRKSTAVTAPIDRTGAPLTSAYGDYLAARHAERRFNPAFAAELFGRILETSPDNPSLMRQAMHQMIEAGRIDDGAKIARRYLKVEPASVTGGFVVAITDLRAGRLAQAEKRLRAIPLRGLGNYFVPFSLSWTLAAEGDIDGALKALAPLQKLRGLGPFHDLHAGLILDFANDAHRAEPYFDKLARNNFSGFLRMVQLAGNFYARRGHTDTAREIYDKFLARQPDSVVIADARKHLAAGAAQPREIAHATDGVAESLFNLATLLNQEGVHEIAMMLARMALYLRPDFDMAQVLVGDIFESAERYPDAVAAYGQVSRSSPLSWSARMRAAQILDRDDKTEEALARLRAMAAEVPDRADVMIALGDILRFRKRFREAVTAYDTAFERIGESSPRQWSLHYSRGIALERTKMWDRAERDFLKALEYEPDQPFVLNYLGYSWVEQGRHLKRALGMLAKAVKLRPNDGYIIDSLGWAHYQLRDFGSAVTYLERAVELSPQDPTINDHLGDALWRVGRHAEARFQWRRALAMGPEPGDVAAIEKKLVGGLGQDGSKREAAGTKPKQQGG